MAAKNEYRVAISIRPGGNCLVERQMHIVNDTWMTIDRYTAHDLTHHPKRLTKWIEDTVKLCSQPSAGIDIAVPPAPLPGETQSEKLARYERELLTTIAHVQSQCVIHDKTPQPFIEQVCATVDRNIENAKHL